MVRLCRSRCGNICPKNLRKRAILENPRPLSALGTSQENRISYYSADGTKGLHSSCEDIRFRQESSLHRSQNLDFHSAVRTMGLSSSCGDISFRQESRFRNIYGSMQNEDVYDPAPGIKGISTSSGDISVKRGSRSAIKENAFFLSFVCGHLARHAQAEHLVSLIQDGDCFVLRFNDLGKITSIYRDFKRENGRKWNRLFKRILRRKSKKGNDKIKKIMVQYKQEGLLEIADGGTSFLEKNDLKYEVKNPDFWHSLTRNYSVQRNQRKKHEDLFGSCSGLSSESSPDAGDGLQSWKWKKRSIVYRQKFVQLRQYGRQHPGVIKEVNGVRVCLEEQFCIGVGSEGTRVYVGLGKDGEESAVKLMPRDACACSAEHDKEILNKSNATKSNHVVNCRVLDEKSDKEYVYLLLDLCEETLANFVVRKRLDYLLAIAPNIIKQILKGLADLHRDPMPILHRDLKPSNILQNVDGKWLLADFGVSRIMEEGAGAPATFQKGSKDWIAVEACPGKRNFDDSNAHYKKKSDIQVAGMVAFFIVTKGEHPFGEEPDRHRNLLGGKPVGLDMVKDLAAKDLISWMLSHNHEERPSAEEALKHPYLQSPEQQFEMLCKIGNQPEIKTGDFRSNVVQMLNSDPKDWRNHMEPDVLTYLSTVSSHGIIYHYRSSWTDCLRLIRNVKEHWHASPRPRPKALNDVGDPQEYFLTLFPILPVVVHKIVRSCDWKERRDLRKYFIQATRRDPHSVRVTVNNEIGENIGDLVVEHREDSSSSNGTNCRNEDDRTSEKPPIDEEEDSDLEDDDDTFLEETFLDSEYSIRDDVHKKFKRFSWLCGGYGIIGPNENIPRTHFYLTVKNEEKKSKIFADLKTAFGCDSNEYFELRPEPKTPARFKYLSQPTSGGVILAVKEEIEPNPLRAPNDIGESGSSKSSAALTMFYFRNEIHYALTCFHASILTDKQEFYEAFNLQKFLDVRRSQSIEWHKEYARSQLKYRYREREINNADNNENIVNNARYTDLGNFCEGSYDSDSDIMSIQVFGNVETDCRLPEIDSPSWQKIWWELQKRVVKKRGKIPVLVNKVGYSSNAADAYIDQIHYSFKYKDELLFKNAIVIKRDSGPFLRSGDSGVLISFVDSKNKQQAFAYGVCENIEEDDSDVIFCETDEPLPANGNESSFICLRLDNALKKLNLPPTTGCFRHCGSQEEE